MKNYYIDTNVISSPTVMKLLRSSSNISDIVVIDAVQKELGKETAQKLKNINIKNIATEFKHLKKLSEIMQLQAIGGNQKLIDLFNNKGTADVLILAHALYEIGITPPNLFGKKHDLATQFIIVTNDVAVSNTATEFDVNVLNQEDFIKLLKK